MNTCIDCKTEISRGHKRCVKCGYSELSKRASELKKSDKRFHGTCLNCGSTFIKRDRNHKKKYCSHECYIEYRKNTVGFKRSKEAIEKGKATVRKNGHHSSVEWIEIECSICGKKMKRVPCQTKSKNPVCSKECNSKRLSLSQIGSDNPIWKGGVTSLESKIRGSLEYKIWRNAVLSRDQRTCFLCDEFGDDVEVHHIKPFSKIVAEFLQINKHLDPVEDTSELYQIARRYMPFWNIDNGLTLCCKCHDKSEAHKKVKER